MNQEQELRLGLSSSTHAFASTDNFIASLSVDPGSTPTGIAKPAVGLPNGLNSTTGPLSNSANNMLISPVQDSSSSITPPTSLTPTPSVNFPQQPAPSSVSSSFLTVQLGSHRTRSRAGTLPSRFTNNIPVSNTTANNNSNVSLVRGPSPLLSPTNAIQEPFEETFLSPTQKTSVNQRSGRLRSGSLFGFDSNIWENSSSPDIFSSPTTNSLNSVSFNAPKSVGISGNSATISESETEHPNNMTSTILSPGSVPTMNIIDDTIPQAVQSTPIPIIKTSDATTSNSPLENSQNLKASFEGSRIRSYTTTNVLLEKQYHLPYNDSNSTVQQEQNLPNSQQTKIYVSPTQEFNESNTSQNIQTNQQRQSFIVQNEPRSSNLVPNVNRPRSQTYTSSNANIPDVELSVVPPLPKNIPILDSNGNSIQMNGNSIQMNGNFHKLETIRRQEQQQQVKLYDQINLNNLEFVSTFQMATLSPTNCILIVNLPPSSFGVSNSMTIFKLCSKFGRVIGVYTFSSEDEKMNVLVEFETIEMSMNAKAQLNQNELYPGYIAIIGFAKIIRNRYLEEGDNHTISSDDDKLQNKITKNSNNKNSNNLSISPSVSFSNKEGISANESRSPSNGSNGIIVSPNGEKQFNASKIPNNASSPCNSTRAIFNVPEFIQVQETVLNTFKDFNDKKGFSKYDGPDLNYDYAVYLVSQAINYQGLDTDFGPLPPIKSNKLFDNPTLRDIRKNLDAFSSHNHNSTHFSLFDIESLSMSMLDELAELSSDYLGNTIVQRLFDINDETIKNIMLKKVAPYLSQMGIHKNGTWAGQKMINLANTNIQKQIVRDSLYPYVAPLFKDAFGNYLIQGCLKFDSPFNDFIFEALCCKFWLVAEDRYGSRAIRAVLESGNCNEEQTYLLASLIVVYAEHLIIHSNGSLLITWFLDTFNFADKYKMLTVKILPFLNDLVANKLGSLTILKILSNRNDFESGIMILKEIYGLDDRDIDNSNNNYDQFGKSPQLLFKILKEFNYGPTFIHKTLSTSVPMERDLKPLLVERIKRALLEMNVSPHQQNYRRLMEEVGLGNTMIAANSSSNSGASNGVMMNSSHSNASGMYINENMYANGYNNNGTAAYVVPQGHMPQPGVFERNQMARPQSQSQHQHHQQQHQQHQHHQQTVYPGGDIGMQGYGMVGRGMLPQGYPMNFVGMNGMYVGEPAQQQQYMMYNNMANQFSNMRIN